MRVKERDIELAMSGSFAAFKRLEKCTSGQIPVVLITHIVSVLTQARAENSELRQQIKRLESIKKNKSILRSLPSVDEDYFVYVFSDGIIHKVGITKNINQRLRTVQSGCASELFVHSQVSLSSKKLAVRLERRCHRHFASYRQSGEWFSGVSSDSIGEWLLANK